MEKKMEENQETVTDGGFRDDNSLAQTPSLPSYQVVEDPESEFTLSTLIRQASLTSSDVFTNNNRPRNHRKKAMKKSYSAPRAGPGNNNNKPEEMKSIEVKQTENQVEKKQANLRKTMSNLETQMFGLRRQEVAATAFEDGQTSSSSNVPRWPVKASSVEDMKAQIKFWARSVAANANVR